MQRTWSICNTAVPLHPSRPRPQSSSGRSPTWQWFRRIRSQWKRWVRWPYWRDGTVSFEKDLRLKNKGVWNIELPKRLVEFGDNSWCFFNKIISLFACCPIQKFFNFRRRNPLQLQKTSGKKWLRNFMCVSTPTLPIAVGFSNIFRELILVGMFYPSLWHQALPLADEAEDDASFFPEDSQEVQQAEAASFLNSCWTGLIERIILRLSF